MSDSGISEASIDVDNKVEELDVIFDEEEKENDDTFDNTVNQRNLQRNSFLSRSVMSLGGVTSSFSYSTTSLSRSESSCSLASSIGSLNPVTVSDIRSLTNNYQKLLRKATREIKKLNLDVKKLEQEQEKLLQANVDLALETKNLLLGQKAWKKDEQELVKANEEFANEVERLYKVEEDQANEIESLQQQIQELKEKFQVEKSKLNMKHLEEQSKLKAEIDEVTESLNTAHEKSNQLLVEKKTVEDELSCSIEYIRSSYRSDRVKFEAKINTLENSLVKERELKEESALKAWELTQDLEKSKNELGKISSDYHDSLINIEVKVVKLKEENENIKSENFELVAENDELKKNQDGRLEREQKLITEVSQLSLENQWLMNSLKMTSVDIGEDMGHVKEELREEREKVKNLSCWKSQLVEKNNKLQEENKRLTARAEHLEGLMNNEVTDINEILTVLNTS